jgi:O-antigen/teichoic acid export membrane protein
MSLSRSARFARSILSGYLLMGLNIAYSLCTVPLALHYLSRPEFGLWALVTQFAGYIALVDLGMAHSVSRTLVDHKDTRADGLYGSVLQTGFYVNVVQTVLIVVAGVLLSLGASSWLQIDPELQQNFRMMMMAQSGVMGFTFLLRPLGQMLDAHQRYDVVNLGGMLNLLISGVAMAGGFHLGYGTLSYVWASFLAQVGGGLFLWWNCSRLGLIPRHGEWGQPTRALFRELFLFGKDVLLYNLGSQLMNASQTILLTHTLGLEASAVWAICTRAFTLLSTFIYRIFDFSAGALSEMMVRGEGQRLLHRFRSIVTVSGSLAIFAAVMLAACNESFVSVWTRGRIAWSPWNDLLLGVWLVVLTLMHSHCGLIGVSKRYEAMRYLYFLEGLFFVGSSLALVSRWGVAGMISISILATVLFTLHYGLRRSSRLFALPFHEVLWTWSQPLLRVAVGLVPIVLLVHSLWHPASSLARLIGLIVAGGLPGVWILARWGVDRDLRHEIRGRLPRSLQPAVRWILG